MIKSNISIEKLPTSETADKHIVHKWFNFVAGYSPEYVELVIDEFQKKNGYKPSKILDPFAGCATTNVVANFNGIESIGIERNPFFYKIGLAKVNANEVIKEIPNIVIDFYAYINKPNNDDYVSLLSESASKYLLKMYDKLTLNKLLGLSELVKHKEQNSIKYLSGYVFLSKMLEYTTSAKTDGIYKVPTSKKNAIEIEDAIEKTKHIFLDDGIADKENKCNYIYASSTEVKMEPNSLDLVIFSPPYLNNFDFAEMTRMQMYFWGEANSWADISENHRNHMLVNTTTALKNVRSDFVQLQLKNCLPDKLIDMIDPVIEELKNIKKENSKKKEYYLLFYPYLAQMKEILTHSYNGLKEIGEIHIVVSDAAFYGIHVDTQKYLEVLLKDIGFKNINTIRLRDRGDRWILEKRKSSGKQLGEFEIRGEK